MEGPCGIHECSDITVGVEGPCSTHQCSDITLGVEGPCSSNQCSDITLENLVICGIETYIIPI